MGEHNRYHVLINLPTGFYKTKELDDIFTRLQNFGDVRQRSYNTNEEIMDDLSWANAVIMWSWPVFTDQDIARLPNLRYVGQINTTQTCAKACLSHGIAISEARHGWSPAVAEMGLGLILNGLRKISDYHAQMRTGHEKWIAEFPYDVDPLERQLTGRSVGIVGFGRIGQRLAELLGPFNVELRVHDPYLQPDVFKKYGATQVEVGELFNKSEIVVLCAANNSASEKLVGKNEINALRSNGMIVNIGRSSLIDMDALIERLKKGDMVAMLDVFDSEPLGLDSPLRMLNNAYLTPHRAGGLIESIRRSLLMLTEDMEACFSDKSRKYAVTAGMLPSFPD